MNNMKTIRPNLIRLFVVTLAWTVAASLITVAFNSGRDWLAAILGIGLLGACIISLFFWLLLVPREIQYDKITFSLRGTLKDQRTYNWGQLVAYGYGKNVFIMKFDDPGQYSLQFVSYAFRPVDWKDFLRFLISNYPGKNGSDRFIRPISESPNQGV